MDGVLPVRARTDRTEPRILAARAPSAQGLARAVFSLPPARFHFKLVDGDGRLLLQGDGHASPRDCGQVIARLKREGAAALQEMEARAVGLLGERIGTLGEDLADVQEIASALAQLVEGEA